VHAPNAEQRDEWDGPEGRRWVELQERWDLALAPVGEALAEAAAVAPGERVLDVGCGCGASTIEAGRRAAPGPVLGVDLSGPMLARARERAADAGLGNVRFERADAQVHDFGPDAFDVVLSRFGITYFEDPVAAFANLRSALRPGGRLVFVCFRHPLRNSWVTVPAVAVGAHLGRPRDEGPAAGPFSFRDRDLVLRTLAAAGLADVTAEPVDRPAVIGRDLDEACRFVLHNSLHRRFFDGAPEAARAAAVDALRAALGSRLGPGGVTLGVAAWLVTATRPGQPALRSSRQASQSPTGPRSQAGPFTPSEKSVNPSAT
jgi:SAM-dependent methyltransferase